MKILLLFLFLLSVVNSQVIYRINYNINDNITIVTGSQQYYYSKWNMITRYRGNETRIMLNFDCNTNKLNESERICITDIKGKQDLLYGYEILATTVSDVDTFTETDYLKYDVMPIPIVYNISSLPSTRGNNITVHGDWLRFGMFSPIYTGPMGVTRQKIPVDYYGSTFNSQHIILQYPSGCGFQSISFNEKLEPRPSFNFTYLNPSIVKSNLSPDQHTLTISGDNFCNETVYVNVTIGDDIIYHGGTNDTGEILSVDHELIKLNYHSDRQLYCGSVPIIINAMGVYSKGVNTITFSPVIKGINSVAISKGGIVTITGIRLSTRDTTSSYKIKIGAIDCKYLNSTVYQLTCLLPPGTGNNLTISVTINNIQSLNDDKNIVLFSYGIPFIKSYKLIGNKVTLNGTSFGNSINTTTVNIKPLLYSIQFNNDNETSITFEIPGDFNNGSDIYVTTSNGKQSNTIQIITSLYILLDTSNYPNTTGSIEPVSIYFINTNNSNSTPKMFNIDSNTTIESNSSLVTVNKDGSKKYMFSFPRGCGNYNNVSFTINDQIYTTTYSYKSPTINKCASTGNDTITCYGNNFGNDQTNVNISFSNQYNIQVLFINDTSFVFSLLPNHFKSIITINVCGQTSNDNIQIELQPKFEKIQMVNDKFNTSGGYIVLSGTYLTIDGIKPTFKLDDNTTILHHCEFINGTEIKCYLNIVGSGVNSKSISLYLNNELKQSFSITYYPPVLKSVNGGVVNGTIEVPIYPMKGGKLFINGLNFNNPINYVSVGLLQCTNIVLIDFNNIQCDLPSLLDTSTISSYDDSLLVTVDVDSQNSSGYLFKYTEEPLNDTDNNNNHKLKWLVPAIIFPIVIVLGAISIVIFIFRKKLPCFKNSHHEKQ